MPVDDQNVSMVAGDSRTLRITVEGDDLTGCSARWWLGRSPRSAGSLVFVQKATGSGIEIETPDTEPVIVVTLDPDDTAELRPGRYYHECEVVDGNGDVATVTTGWFTLRPALITPA